MRPTNVVGYKSSFVPRPQDNSAMKGFDEYFEEFCAQKDLEIENSHPSATCTNRLELTLLPDPFPLQCKESKATGTIGIPLW